MAKLEGVKTLDMVGGEITKVAYGGEEYVKVEGDAQAGDLIKLNDKAYFCVTAGAFYLVIKAGQKAYIIDDENDNHPWGEAYYDAFRKVSAQPAPAPIEERVATLEKRVDALSPAEPSYRKIDKAEAQAGDFVKFAEDHTDIIAGKQYELFTVKSGGLAFHDDEKDVRRNPVRYFDDASFYTLRPEEEKPEQPALKVGDYAKVVGNEVGHSFSIGEIVVISAVRMSGEVDAAEHLDGSDSWFIDPADVIPATDEEVAAAKAEADRKAAEEALAAKWAKIGRKPGEYKKGDIVRVISRLGTVQLYDGQITEVVTPYSNGAPSVSANDGGTRFARAELITPVEARFDA